MFKGIKRWFKKPNVTAGYVYYVKFKFNQDTFYKIGFTTKNSVIERFSYAGSNDFNNVEKVLLFTYNSNAWGIEQDLLEYFQKQLAFGKYSNDPTKPLAGNGQSELFNTDVLGLDKELYKVPDTIFKEVTEARENVVFGFLLTVGAIVFTGGIWLIVLIIVGIASMFESADTLKLVPQTPKHPHHIQDLINALVAHSEHTET